jgi:hypothetical protein
VLAFKEGRRDPKKPARCSQQMARRPSAAGRHPRHSTKPSRSLDGLRVFSRGHTLRMDVDSMQRVLPAS